MEKYFEIGQIVNIVGLNGTLKIKPFTDNLTEFDELKTILIDNKGTLKEFTIENLRYNKNMVIIKLQGVDNIEEAQKLRNLLVKRKRKEKEPLPSNSYYIVDLLGCEVFLEDNTKLGNIVDIFKTGSNDVYVVKDLQGKEILLPAISDVIKHIDVKNKRIIVRLMNGLL